MPKSALPIFQLKITLRHIRPPVWRRVLVPADVKLSMLHRIIQAAFDWEGYHLHMFTSGGIDYGVPSPDDWRPVRDERRIALHDLLKKPKDELLYEYDFGDSWEHRVVLEKVLSQNPDQRLPLCSAGKRARPPEDCGGPWGYAEFLQIIANPSHEEHDEYLEWAGGAFDPEAFDLEEANAAVAAVLLTQSRSRA